MHEYLSRRPIRTWAEDDRPRERILQHGVRSASENELLAILIGSGTSKATALDLSRHMLEQSNRDLSVLCRMSPHQLCAFEGIGPAKAVVIASAFELGRRLETQRGKAKKRISSSKDVAMIFRPKLADLSHEEFWLLMLNRANMVIAEAMISRGGLAGTVADPKVIFERALASRASSVILVHNHPSGNQNPSEADRKLTKQLKNAGEFLDLPVLDHVIIAGSDYFSFADDGLL